MRKANNEKIFQLKKLNGPKKRKKDTTEKVDESSLPLLWKHECLKKLLLAKRSFFLNAKNLLVKSGQPLLIAIVNTLTAQICGQNVYFGCFSSLRICSQLFQNLDWTIFVNISYTHPKKRMSQCIADSTLDLQNKAVRIICKSCAVCCECFLWIFVQC